METRRLTGSRRARALVTFLSLTSLLSLGPARAQASVPGGFVENAGSTEVRPKLTAAEIQALLPSRGPFMFPAPYGTAGVRLTNSTDCAGSDCVYPVGYSYWRNLNNHVGSNTMYIFLGLKSTAGGAGPTLFTYDKVTEEVVNAGPLFAAGSKYRGYTAEGWYFSATLPTVLYLNDGAKMLRYDVVSKQFTTVYDAAPQFGSDKYIWQMHSSDDDRVHIATLRALASGAMLGCLAYKSDTAQFQYFPAIGTLDECHVDHSGRWLLMLEDVDGAFQLDNRIIDLQTGSERTLLDQNGAVGHAEQVGVDGVAVARVSAQHQLAPVVGEAREAIRLLAARREPPEPGSVGADQVDLRVHPPARRKREGELRPVGRPLDEANRVVERGHGLGPAAVHGHAPHLRQAAEVRDEGDP